MRLGSVMSVIDVIHPVCWPRASTKGETYKRAANKLWSLRMTRTCMPLGLVRPVNSSCKRKVKVSRSSSGQ